jgi:NAD(P)-dependent dehydrogenase (short-subunit alcohol dehydrogenase family)
MGKLDEKVAIVTGAARGLGRAYAKRLAGLGAKVRQQNFLCRLCGNHASTANFHARSNAAANGRRASSER